MLGAMQQPASPAAFPPSSTFAGLLAALSARPRETAERSPDWSGDGLADDVATLSYERALRAHGRYRASEAGGRALTQPEGKESLRIFEADPAEPGRAAPGAAEHRVASGIADAEPESASGIATAHDRNLKSASITIRVSQAECDQLRQRAADAGLTVSAYMRSCTFEAERLRELVKDTLAQWRSEQPKQSREPRPAVNGTGRSWLRRLLQHGQTSQTIGA
jgi:predicted DNA binding CopG/RHH family protein